MKLILLILTFFSTSASATFLPQIHQPSVQAGIDPICALAIQAGMTGQRQNIQNTPEGLKNKIEDELKGIEDSMRELKASFKEEGKYFIGITEKNALSCGSSCNENLYFKEDQVDQAKNALGNDTTVQKRVIEHIKKGSNKNQNCSSSSSSGVVYLKDSSYFLLTKALPFIFMFPQKVYAQTSISANDSRINYSYIKRQHCNPGDQRCEACVEADNRKEETINDCVAEQKEPQVEIDKVAEEVQEEGTAEETQQERTAEEDRQSTQDDSPTRTLQSQDPCTQCECRVDKYLKNKGLVDAEGFCNDTDFAFKEPDSCEDSLKEILEIMEEIEELKKIKKDLNDELKKLERDIIKQDREKGRLKRFCRTNSSDPKCQPDSQTEASAFCTECFQEVMDAFHPKPTTMELLLNAAVPLAGAGLAAYSIKGSNTLRSRQGYAVDNTAAYGLAYPFITQMLYGGALTGRGSNALACSSSSHHNPSSYPGSPYPGSPYPGSPYPGSPYPGSPYPGSPYPGSPYPGSPYPGSPYPGSPYPGSPYPGSPYPGSPYPGSPYPGSPYPGSPYPGSPYPGSPYPGSPYPGSPYPGSPYPGGHLDATAQFELQSRVQSILMEQYQVSIDRQRNRQAAEFRIYEEINQLQMQLQGIRTGSGSNFNLRGSFTSDGNFSSGNFNSGSNSSGNSNINL